MKTKKTTTEKLLEKFAIKFVKDHFTEIDFDGLDWGVRSLEDAIKQIEVDNELVEWIISEVMTWGTPVDYLKKITVGRNDDGLVVKINDKYFCLSSRPAFQIKEKVIVINGKIFKLK